MPTPLQLVVAVDESDASERAVRYVAQVLQGTPGAKVVLIHVTDPIPPSWERMGGTMDEAERERAANPVEAELVKTAQERCGPILDSMAKLLSAGGIGAEQIERRWFASAREDSVPEILLGVARDNGCGTVVVGHKALGWYQETFKSHLGQDLVKHGKDLTVWVVE